MRKELKTLYGILAVFVLAIMTIGATYAYWTATAESPGNSVNTNSTIYSISMAITPLYHNFSFIPMNDEDALKGLKNECRDKYGRGACSAYVIRVYDYQENLDSISGYMDVTRDNMENLSYMVLQLSDTYEEASCVEVGSESYCIGQEATAVGDGVHLSLGKTYDVTGKTETKLLLLMWLTNLNVSQNEFDIGNFNAEVTIQAGNGGEIKGTIAAAVQSDMEEDNSDVGEDNEESSESETESETEGESGL